MIFKPATLLPPLAVGLLLGCITLCAANVASDPPAAADLVQVEVEFCPKCRAGNFGVEWDKVGKPGLDLRLPPRILDGIERWFDLPDRLEKSFWYGGFGTGLVIALLVFLFYEVVRQNWRRG